MSNSLHFSARLVLVPVVASLLLPPAVWAAPQGGQVRGGDGEISQQGLQTDILQRSERLSVQWRSFDVGADETVRFRQPSASSVAVNHIGGAKPSEIHGRLEANGRVVLANPRGILFTESSVVNVGALVAAGANVDAAGFVRGDQDHLEFVAGAEGLVINRGLIEAASGVSLFGSSVGNLGDGAVMQGQLVHLGAGERAVVTFGADDMIGVSVSGETLTRLSANAVHNSGVINGDTVLMEATVSAGLFDAAVNNEGWVRATGIETVGGKIRLRGSGGDVVNSGALRASGGDIAILSNRDIRVAATAEIDVSAAGGGGKVAIGTRADTAVVRIESGAVVDASATDRGDGGVVDVLAATRVEQRGAISARGGARGGDGGNVEVSAARLELSGGSVDTRAPAGTDGMLLLDPGDFSIGTNPGGNDLTYADLETALASSNVTIATDPGAPGNGDIRFVDSGSVNLPSPRVLTLDAHRNVEFNGSFSASGAPLDLIINADIDSNMSGDLFVRDQISLPGGSLIAGVVSAILEAGIDTDAFSGTPGPVSITASNTISLNANTGVGGQSSGIVASMVDLIADADDSGVGDLVQQRDAGSVLANLAITLSGAEVVLFDVQVPGGELNITASQNGINSNDTSAVIRADQLVLRSQHGINLGTDVNTLAASSLDGNIRLMNDRALTIGTVDGLNGVAITATSGGRSPIDIEARGDLNLLQPISNTDDGTILLRALDTPAASALLLNSIVSTTGDGELFFEANGDITFGAQAFAQNDNGVLNITGSFVGTGPGSGPEPEFANSFAMTPTSVLQSGSGIKLVARDVDLFDLSAALEIRVWAETLRLRGALDVTGTSGFEIGLNVENLTLFDGATMTATTGDITIGGLMQTGFGDSALNVTMLGSSQLTSLAGLVGIAADSMQLGDIDAATAIVLFGDNGPGDITMLPGTTLSAIALLLQGDGDVTVDSSVSRFAGIVNGSLQLNNSGALEVSTINAAEFGQPFGFSGVEAGTVGIVNDAPLTINAPVDASGDIELRVVDTPASVDDLILAASIESDGGSVRLFAGDAVRASSAFIEAAVDIIVNSSHIDVDGLASDIEINDGSVFAADGLVAVTASGAIRNNDGFLDTLATLVFNDAGLDTDGKLQALLRGDDRYRLTPDGEIQSVASPTMLSPVVDIRGRRAELTAASGIEVETQLAELIAGTGNGDVTIFNLDANRQLRVGERLTMGPGVGITTGAGSINLGSTSAVVVQGNIELTTPGDITIRVADRPDFFDQENLIVDALLRTTDGDITLAAGDALSLNYDSLFARGTLTMTAGYLDVDGLASPLTTQLSRPVLAFAADGIAISGRGDVDVGRLRSDGSVAITTLGAINDGSPFSDSDSVMVLNPETSLMQAVTATNIVASDIVLDALSIGVDSTAADLNISTPGLLTVNAAQSFFIGGDSSLQLGALTAGGTAFLKAPLLEDGDALARIVANNIVLIADRLGSTGAGALDLQLSGILNTDTSSVGGDQHLAISGSATVGSLRAFDPVTLNAGLIALTSTGAITGTAGPHNHIEAAEAAISAATGIDLRTQLARIAAISDRGPVLIANSAGVSGTPLAVTTVAGIVGVTTGGTGDVDGLGDILISHRGALDVLAAIVNEDGGDVTLQSDPAPLSALRIAADVTATAGGKVLLAAHDRIDLDPAFTVGSESGGILVSAGGTQNTGQFFMAASSSLRSVSGAIDVFANSATIANVITGGATHVASDLLTLSASIARSGTAPLQLIANRVVQESGVVLSTDAGDITLQASGGGAAQSLTMQSGARMETVSGDVILTAGTMTLADIASGGAVTLLGGSANGALASLAATRIAAGGGSGSPALLINNRGDVDLRTAVGSLTANVTDGNFTIDNSGELVLLASQPGTPAVVVPNGTATIVTASPLRVDAPVNALGNILLRAGESAGAGDDLSLNANVVSVAGSLQLQAGDSIAQTSGNLVAADAIVLEAGAADTDALSSVTLLAGTSATAAGDITVDSGGDISVAALDAGGLLRVSSSAGALNDDGFAGSRLSAAEVSLNAATGIGSSAALGLNTSSLSAAAGSGALRLDNGSTAATVINLLSSTADIEYSQLSGTTSLPSGAAISGADVVLSVASLLNDGVIGAVDLVDIALSGSNIGSSLGRVDASSTTVSGSGNADTLRVAAPVTGSLFITLAGGDDVLELFGPLTLDLTANLGTGNDMLTAAGGAIVIGGDIDGAAGGDTFNVDASITGGALVAGDGADVLAFGADGAATVFGGDGTDSLSVAGNTANRYSVEAASTTVSNNIGVRIVSADVEQLFDDSSLAPALNAGGAAVSIDSGNSINLSGGDAQILTFNSNAGGELVVLSPAITVNELRLNNADVLLDGVVAGSVIGGTADTQLSAGRLRAINVAGLNLRTEVDRVNLQTSGNIALTNTGTMLVERITTPGAVRLQVIGGDLLAGPSNGSEVINATEINLLASGDIGNRSDPFVLRGSTVRLEGSRIVTPTIFGGRNVNLIGNVVQSLTQLLAVSGINGAVQTLLTELGSVDPAIFTALLPFAADEDAVRLALLDMQRRGLLGDGNIEMLVGPLTEVLQQHNFNAADTHYPRPRLPSKQS